MIIQAYTYNTNKHITDKYIIKYFYSLNGKRLLKNKLDDIPNNIKTYLNNRYKDSLSIEETIQRIHNNISIHPKCPICDNPVKYVGGTRFFLKTCGCNECSKILNLQNKNNTVLEKYGVDNVAKSDIIKEKISNTMKTKKVPKKHLPKSITTC